MNNQTMESPEGEILETYRLVITLDQWKSGAITFGVTGDEKIQDVDRIGLRETLNRGTTFGLLGCITLRNFLANRWIKEALDRVSEAYSQINGPKGEPREGSREPEDSQTVH